MKARNVITDAPVARPSRPSVRFTPLLVAVTINAIQMTTRIGPSEMLVSRSVERFSEIGVSPSLSGK